MLCYRLTLLVDFSLIIGEKWTVSESSIHSIENQCSR